MWLDETLHVPSVNRAYSEFQLPSLLLCFWITGTALTVSFSVVFASRVLKTDSVELPPPDVAQFRSCFTLPCGWVESRGVKAHRPNFWSSFYVKLCPMDKEETHKPTSDVQQLHQVQTCNRNRTTKSTEWKKKKILKMIKFKFSQATIVEFPQFPLLSVWKAQYRGRNKAGTEKCRFTK